MNNYEERAMSHKRVRMEGEAPAGLVQPNGLPLSYMDNGHQIPYQPYAGSYNAHYPPTEVAFGGYGPGGDLAGYASRGLSYAPPAHQAYPPPPQPSAAFVQQQQQQLLHSYESQHHAHSQHPAHKPAWSPQALMQPIQVVNDGRCTTNEQLMKNDMKVKQEIKLEPSVPIEPAGSSAISMRAVTESHPIKKFFQNIDAASPGLGNQMNEDPPKIKIKTDIFKEEEAANLNRRGVITESGNIDKSISSCAESDPSKIRHTLSLESGIDPNKKMMEHSVIKEGLTDSDLLGMNTGSADVEGGKSRISDSGNSTDSANKNKFQGFSDSESSSSSEDDTKIPNEIYFGTPDISTYRPKLAAVATTTPVLPVIKPVTTTPGTGEVKKRGRPKGSCNKPKPPNPIGAPGTPTGVPRPQVNRPRGGSHVGTFAAHPIRPFKRDFSGIRFRRRFSDDGLDSSNIPNEVYFGDVPVSMEILFNYYDTNAEREKQQMQQKGGQQTPGNVTLVYSSSDSSSDDSSDSDSSDTDNEPIQVPVKRGPGRPRGSKTINRRSDGQRLSGGNSPGDKPFGITDMKKFLKIAGIEYDYAKLVDGCLSNKERVSRLLGLLHAKGLEGPPTPEACRALYTGPPPRRRGPKPGTKRTPKATVASSNDDIDLDIPSPKSTPVAGDDESRRVTRGQTSGKPRQRIVISSDEEDSHTPLSKLRTMR